MPLRMRTDACWRQFFPAPSSVFLCLERPSDLSIASLFVSFQLKPTKQSTTLRFFLPCDLFMLFPLERTSASHLSSP